MMIIDDQVNETFRFDPERVQRYKVILRRNRLFGFWVGKQLGKIDCEMLYYIASVVDADLEEPGDRDIIQKVRDDMRTAGIKVSGAALRAKLDALHAQARRELGGPSPDQPTS
ncbi:DUF1476 domain-containing protein [Microvirga sp. HBU67558]|uniref:DUF1476 domain-containing protein n=1 Tax=Microvirga TaxID=186650 RepID=UPI001B380C9F|nr:MULTISPECIES: DUF1476 domain-containing protein [unclassified Microvirga]MBQ0822597.1 DUF1476 domain-containing protein [Microvirga sp. HBU67558]